MTNQSAPNWSAYDPLPHDHWRECAYQFAEKCYRQFWSGRPMAKSARRFLKNRGFSVETLEQANIGLNIKDQAGDRGYWGLPLGNPVGRSGPIWLPRGLVFPWADETGLSRLYIRRLRNDVGPESDKPENGKGNRIPDCISPLYGATSVDSELPVVLVEREFDALAIRDEASDLCSAVATGDPEGARRTDWRQLLMDAPAVLVAFDVSDAGQEAAATWMGALPNAHWWPTYIDDRDARMQPGERLRNWVQEGIADASSGQ